MSIEALKWAFEQEQVPSGPRFVLVALANRANEEGGDLYPSLRWIKKKTGIPERTIRQYISDLQKFGLLVKTERRREDGGRTSNEYLLPLLQPGLRFNTPPAVTAAGRDAVAGGPAANAAPPRQPPPEPPAATAGQETKEETKEKRKGGRAAPSAVSLAFQRYSGHIKTTYGAEYPPSARANGQLSNVVSRVGAEPTLAVIDAYFSSSNSFYAKVRHSLKFLQQDCERLWLDLQITSGQAQPKPATHAIVQFLRDDGQILRDLGQQPIGAPLDVARRALADYGRIVARLEPKYVSVLIGRDRRVLAIEELKKEPVPA